MSIFDWTTVETNIEALDSYTDEELVEIGAELDYTVKGAGLKLRAISNQIQRRLEAREGTVLYGSDHSGTLIRENEHDWDPSVIEKLYEEAMLLSQPWADGFAKALLPVPPQPRWRVATAKMLAFQKRIGGDVAAALEAAHTVRPKSERIRYEAIDRETGEIK